MNEPIDLRRHRLARDHGTKVETDVEGYEFVQLESGCRIVFDYPVSAEWLSKQAEDE